MKRPMLIFFLGLLLISFACSVYANFMSALWGKSPQSSIIFEPIGYHIIDAYRDQPQPNNMNYLVSINYKTFIIGTFNNSLHHQVYYAGINRDFFNYKKLTLNYMFGIMHGYGNFLQDTLGPTLGNDPGPLLAFNIRYNLVKNVDFFSSYFGVGILFGASYRF